MSWRTRVTPSRRSRPGSLITEVIASLAQHHVGALVVTSDGQRIEGIVSERDVVRALHSRGATC